MEMTMPFASVSFQSIQKVKSTTDGKRCMMGELSVGFLFSFQSCHISAVSYFTTTFTLLGQARDGRPGRGVESVK